MIWPVLLALAAAECEDGSLHLLQQKTAKRSVTLASQGRSHEVFTKVAPCSGPVQVLTDVDDTFMSSGGQWPAGCDGVYEKHVIYPGFAQFVVELARGPEEALYVLRPAIFSARPESFGFLKVDQNSPLAGALKPEVDPNDPAIWDQYNAELKIEVPENMVAYNYQDGGFQQVLKHTEGQKLTSFGLNVAGSKYGHFDDFVDFTKIGNTKYENFQEVFLEEAAKDSAKACAIFIGDDGQGDCNPASEKMRKFVKPGTQELGMKAAFIHQLTCSDKPTCEAAEATPDAAPRILFVTYLDAARKAQQHGLISEAAVGRVRSAVDVFFQVYCDEDGTSRAPETVGNLGCEQLWKALQAEPPSKEEEEETSEDAAGTRPARRFEAWCLHCCNGQISNGRGTYDFERKTFRCYNKYHTTSMWRVNWSAGNGACHSHCRSK